MSGGAAYLIFWLIGSGVILTVIARLTGPWISTGWQDRNGFHYGNQDSTAPLPNCGGGDRENPETALPVATDLNLLHNDGDNQ